MEHLSTFGLTRDPFASDTQPDAAFDTAAARDVLRRLERAAMQSKGLCLLTGRGGVGKTLLVRRLLEALEEDVFEACMLVPVPGITNGRWLLSRFARQLGIEAPSEDLGDLLGQVYEQMAIVREDGRHTVLLIDEAQVLADAGLLANLRGLLNLEYEEKRLLSLVLVGLPGLLEAVENEPALCDRLDLRVSLTPLSDEEASQYIAHRIRAVEGTPAILESSAMSALVKCGEGVPRRLNTLADNALFEAHLAGRMSATAEDVERAAAEMGLSQPLQPEAPSEAPAPVASDPTAPAEPAMAAPLADPTLDDFGTADPVLAEPAPSSFAAPESGLADIFDDSDAELELSEVVAADTDPKILSADAGATIAIMSEMPELPSLAAAVAPDATMAIFDSPDPAPANDSAGQTAAIFDDLNEDTDGDLDDLFADLVDE